MKNYIVIGGHSIEELEMNLAMAKKAIAMGVPYGIGGSSIEDVEQGMNLMRSMMGGNAPIDNPNYVGVPPIEDEDEDTYCPNCGAPLDEDGYCHNCDYPESECEDEEEDEEMSADMIDHITNQYGLPSAWSEIMKKMLGL